jgi:hypothetical protein
VTYKIPATFCTKQELGLLLRASIDQFKAANGVILFLYSVLLSRVLHGIWPRIH